MNKKCLFTLFFLTIFLVFKINATIIDEEFRIQKYHPYPFPSTIANELKTSTYSQFENPTGIYFDQGEKGEVIIKKETDEKLFLIIHNFDKEGGHQEIPLKQGRNPFTCQTKGLAYIKYFTGNPQAKPIVIKINGGKVNGYFNIKKHTNQDWQDLLNNAACNIMDLYGERVQLAYSVSSLKKYCPNQGVELLKKYDQIIKIQHQLMGLDRYKRVPKNHIFGRVIWKGYMHADGLGAAFHDNTMHEVANLGRLTQSSWGVAHEFGHVNQTRPGLKWVSTTEVTNNIFSAWTQYLFTPNNLRLEQEECNDGSEYAAGGRFNSFLNSALVNKEQWLCQKGPDKLTGYENGGDHFVKLCPLWQLQLYYAVAGKDNKWSNPHFYGDICEKIRCQKGAIQTNGDHQLFFIKAACDIAKEDLTDFFTKVGMLKPINKELDDYSRGQLTISEAECQKLRQYAKRYPKPLSPVIYYLSGNSIEAFQKQLDITGTFGQGVKQQERYLIVDHKVWRNIVAFECYQGNTLVRCCIVYTGDRSKNTTRILYPEGATRLEAIAWNGKRTLIFGER